MSIKISELPQASTVNNTDVIPIVQNGTTKQVTAELLRQNTYSTAEQRIGTWIDGKPLYERTVSTPSPTVTTDGTDSIAHIDISNTIDFSFISFQIAYATQQCFPLPYVVVATPPRRMTCRTDRNSGTNMTSITILSNGTGFNNTTTVATIRYTKTTDTATRSLNLTRSANTGELVGTGDRVELTDETKQDEEQIEKQVEQVKDQVENISAEPIETKTEGSGDTI